jgi:hypothetical protein
VLALQSWLMTVIHVQQTQNLVQLNDISIEVCVRVCTVMDPHNMSHEALETLLMQLCGSLTSPYNLRALTLLTLAGL